MCREIDGIRPEYEQHAAFCPFMAERNECDEDIVAYVSETNRNGNDPNLTYHQQPEWIQRELEEFRRREWLNYNSFEAAKAIDPQSVQAIRDIGDNFEKLLMGCVEIDRNATRRSVHQTHDDVAFLAKHRLTVNDSEKMYGRKDSPHSTMKHYG